MKPGRTFVYRGALPLRGFRNPLMVQFLKAASPPDGVFFHPPMSADPNHDSHRSRLPILNKVFQVSGFSSDGPFVGRCFLSFIPSDRSPAI
jgi:hypothetical protein